MKNKAILSILIIIILIFSSNTATSSKILTEEKTKINITKNTDEIEKIIETQTEKINNNNLLKTQYRPGELIIKYKNKINYKTKTNKDETLKTDKISLNILNKKYKAIEIKEIKNSNDNIIKLILDKDTNIKKAVEEYTKNPNVQYAEPNYILHLNIIPNDPLFNQQWALNNTGQNNGKPNADINAPEAWDIETGSKNVTIAILDSGVDYTHPDLKSNIWINNKEDINNNNKFDNWPKWRKIQGVSGDIDHKDNDGNGFVDDVVGWNFFGDDNNPTDNVGHGTHCAGIASATTNNNIGVAGISWNSKILPIKIGDDLSIDIYGAMEAIQYCIDNNVDIISMSWGGKGSSKTFDEIIDKAYENGIVLVSAAGNAKVDIGAMKFIPASNPKTITVAATDNKDKLAHFSCYGNPVDLSAPGVNILSLRAKNTNLYDDEKYVVDEDYLLASGTSMSCPYIAGVAALILSKEPDLTPSEVKTILKSSTDKINSKYYAGTGRINTSKALNKIKKVTTEINLSIDTKEVNTSFNVNGSAYGQDFQEYIIEYNKGQQPETWNEYYNSTEQIKNSTLTEFNVTNLDDGLYTLRLKTICDGEIYEDRSLFLVNKKTETLYVDAKGGQNYTNITEALFNAGNRDKIYVYNGTYYENVFISRSIDLIGENQENTIINSSDIAITLDFVKDAAIKNFKIEAKIVGILSFLIDNVTISNNIIEKTEQFGIYLDFAIESNINNNIIKNTEIGIISLMAGYKNEYENNTIKNNLVGLFLTTGEMFGNISNNKIDQNTIGIMIYGISTFNTVKQNDITNSTLVGLAIRRRSVFNRILNNNFENNMIAAKFAGCIKNTWKNNYWNRPRILPKIILGSFGFLKIPWFNIDMSPAKSKN